MFATTNTIAPIINAAMITAKINPIIVDTIMFSKRCLSISLRTFLGYGVENDISVKYIR
jgi:hypothetical protein